MSQVIEISRSLELPDGYQRFDWYVDGKFSNDGVMLNSPAALRNALVSADDSDMYLYTQHLVFYEDGVLKQTRSSPNWEGGMATYATCKHLMRTYNRPDGWERVWIAGLCPAHCERNCLLFVGQVQKVFASNYDLSKCLRNNYPVQYKAKRANVNPRGDLYTPLKLLSGDEVYDHSNYEEPPGHTRSVEFYGKSPGSRSNRPDGKVPKWWRDVEYIQHGRRPPSFVLAPCYLFSRPLVWSGYKPGRAVLRLTPAALAASLRTQPPSG